MKLQANRPVGLNIVTAHGEGYFAINGEAHHQSLLVTPQRLETAWIAGGIEALTVADFQRLAQLNCEVLILGTGIRQRFPEPSLLAPMMAARIGVEVMDSAAAARTYNILAAEGRQVAALLLVDRA
ncbi:hypothetical protein GALL_170420 [mine drainage metagenome]|uniref:Protein containing DUF498 n=1 Tax=mine drainage metagenome TaxID=410659 RepID=A0A1J5SLF9_9ZZZZ